MRFRTQFDEDYKPEVFFTDVGEDEDLVQQHMRDECDINVIMKRYQQTGELTHIARIAGEYGDFYDVDDYKSGMDRIIAANDLFMELPSSIRDRFDNDPAKFIEFATDEENLDEMREMGLAEPKSAEPAPPASQRAEPVAPLAAPNKPESGD